MPEHSSLTATALEKDQHMQAPSLPSMPFARLPWVTKNNPSLKDYRGRDLGRHLSQVPSGNQTPNPGGSRSGMHVSLELLKITPVSKTIGEGVWGGVYHKRHRGIKLQILEGVAQVWIRSLPVSQLIQRLHCSLSRGVELLSPCLNLIMIHPQTEVFTAAHPLPSEDVLDLLKEKNEKIYLHIYTYIYIYI